MSSRKKRSNNAKPNPAAKAGHSRSFWVAVGSSIGFVISFFANIAQLRGPFWPTIPVVDAGPPDNSEAFSVPFTVKNASFLFPISNVVFTCFIDYSTDQHTEIRNVQTRRTAPEYLEPESVNIFKCWFPFKVDGKLKAAKLEIHAGYDASLPWKNTADQSLGTFFWDSDASPPRWLAGRPLSK